MSGDVEPIGSWDSVTVVGGTVQISGWAADRNTTGPVKVLVLSKMGLSTTMTGLSRPDVNPVAGPNRGWALSIGGFPPGRTFACVGVANVGPKGGNKLIGCRYFTVDDVPTGNVETVSVQRDRIRVTGWAGLAGSSNVAEVRMLVAGQVVVVSTTIPRPDVAAAGFGGAASGFEILSPPLPTGTYPICVSTNSPGSAGQFLACRNVTISAPFGSLDGVDVAATGEGITVAGWAADVDAPAEGLAVRVSADRIEDYGDPVFASGTANGYRPDVAAAYPALGASHGFSVTMPFLPVGTYRVCAAVSPAGVGDAVLFGCRVLAVANHRPVGSIDSVTAVSSTSVRVVGHATDPDTASPLTVTVRVGGEVASTTTSTGSFDRTVSGIPAGVQSVCVTVGNVGLGADVAFTCGTVVMGAMSVVTTGSTGAPTPVGPAASNPLARIDRDAGISTTLSDGSTLWLFGDSAERDNVGNFRYFVNNTAAWAAPGAPAVTRDGTVGGMPATFVTRTVDLGCPAAMPSQIMWPLSAVTVPVNATTDRVVAYFQNICLGPNLATDSRGVAVVEWIYHRNSPPAEQPIVGTVLAQRIFPTNTYGNAAVFVAAENFIYNYACFGPAGGGLPDAYGPCKVARVTPTNVANPSLYTYWDGDTWEADQAQAAAMTLPVGVNGINNPVATLTVTWDAAHGVYVMAYSPWPGFTNKVVVRVATLPQGPWTAPVEITLPGCVDTVGGTGFYCYAGTAQPQFSVAPVGAADGLLGIGYFDQLIAVGPNRGGYQYVTVPFRVYLPGQL